MPISEPHFIDKFVTLDQKSGMPKPVVWRRNIQPFALYFDEQFTSGAFSVNAAGAGLPTPMAMFRVRHHSLGWDEGYGNPLLMTNATFASNDGAAELTPAANFTLLVKDMGDKSQFMNAPIHIRTFAYTSQFAPKLFEPLFIPSRHVLDVQFAKIAGSATNVYMYLWGQQFIPWATDLQLYQQDRHVMLNVLQKYINRRRYVIPFWLTTEQQVSLTANQTREFDALLGDDGHFEASHILAVSDGTFGLEITDPDKKQTYMNGAISSAAAIGDAQWAQKFAVPLLVEQGRRLRFKVTDTSGSANKVFITLRGRRIRAPLNDVEQVKKDLEVGR